MPQASAVSSSNAMNAPSTPDGYEIGQAPTSVQGFYGATPITQPGSPTGNVHTPTVGATTGVFVNTTFDGSIGSTAYTIGDIVIALKNLGLIAK